MARTREERSLAGGQEKDRILIRLLKARAPYAEIKQALLELEKRWLREAKAPTERLAVRRGIAEDILTQAFSFDQPWEEAGRWLRRVRRLGFSNLALRVHLACMYVQALHLFPHRARDAWELLEDTERRVLRLRKGHPMREESLESIAHAKRVARVARPPAP